MGVMTLALSIFSIVPMSLSLVNRSLLTSLFLTVFIQYYCSFSIFVFTSLFSTSCLSFIFFIKLSLSISCLKIFSDRLFFAPNFAIYFIYHTFLHLFIYSSISCFFVTSLFSLFSFFFFFFLSQFVFFICVFFLFLAVFLLIFLLLCRFCPCACDVKTKNEIDFITLKNPDNLCYSL
jgi:hypothetical protein